MLQKSGFARLLIIVASVRVLDGAAYRSPHGFEECDASVQSSAISKCGKVTRRLKIFESITKHSYLPMFIGYKEGSRIPEDEKTMNEILQYSLVELTEILQTLEIRDPWKAMRIPVHVITLQSPETLMVFESLLLMLSIPKGSRGPTQLQQYLKEAISNQQCSKVNLCNKWPQNFKCDEMGHLKEILLDNSGRLDHLNLLMIPNTVKTLSLRNTNLKSISGWTELKGKSLRTLYVDGNAGLELNLIGLSRPDLEYFPLDHLSVSPRSIANYFGEGDRQRALSRIGKWMRKSTLRSLTLRHGIDGTKKRSQRCTRVYFDCDGSCTSYT